MSYDNPIWMDWYSVAEPLNKLVPWLTFGLSALWWAVIPVKPTGYVSWSLVSFLPGFIMGILSGLFYYLILQERIELKNIDNQTLIWLLICLGLSLFTVGGVVMWVQFLLVGILGDRPVWKLFTEKGVKYY